MCDGGGTPDGKRFKNYPFFDHILGYRLNNLGFWTPVQQDTEQWKKLGLFEHLGNNTLAQALGQDGLTLSEFQAEKGEIICLTNKILKEL